ncbi:aminotransferase class V-fold PLP-dependent enzyme [Temperatibacter marinus]|uniref:Aminotransferase class V-fold PLP-dependent enzyme n=1 Tax=Temperatibacter marinus TaxID=1456591 RepID=A0AA52EGJ1_9PROT|nr:aminotransferase class V-fold PLP-dependent enzyme [Temperatibacter marinus]WND01919.1 aminotransferase class V-fold PLP-dependent enzyme [Temperatibacter marinus]
MTDKILSHPELDIENIRKNADFDRSRVHLDHAGASFLSKQTVARMQQHLALEAQVAGYVAQEQVAEELEDTYSLLAKCFGAASSDYALTGSAVDSWTKLFYSTPIDKGQNIVTAHTEYCANFVAMVHDQKRRGYEIRIANRLDNGDIDLDHFDQLVDENTALIALTWIGSSSGQILPASKVGEIAARKNALYLLDACQAAGHIPVNFQTVGADMASGTARKFLRGPRGVGFLYASEKARKALNPVVMTNNSASWEATFEIKCRDDARLFEAWERSVMTVLGFRNALSEFHQMGIQALTDQTRLVSNYIRRQLEAMNNVTIGCPPGSEGAIITFNKDGLEAGDAKAAFEKQGIAVNVASVFHTRLDLEARNIDSLIRISPQYMTAQEEVDRFLDVLRAL